MTLDNMTGITEGSYTGFCKSQLITCNFVKACNGVCPFEDALKHADKTQAMNEQHTVDHDRDWIIGCIEHDGFIHTDRFDKANQIIHDALSADTSSDLISRANAIRWVKTECNPYGKPTLEFESGKKVIEHLEQMPSTEPKMKWIPCSERLPNVGENVLFTTDIYGGYVAEGDRRADGKWWQYRWNSLLQNDEVTAWMPLPKPYKGGGSE